MNLQIYSLVNPDKKLVYGKAIIKFSIDLHRVVINSSFAGFIEKWDGEYFRLDGSEIHDLIFAKICQLVG